MVLPDNETKVDLLNSEPIALTIVELLKERDTHPITVGVHGDWGAGKSSILEMIEHALDDDAVRVCLKFNGWRYQGFEDAKIALIEDIVSELIDRRSLATKAAEAVRDILHRIDVLKVAKKAGGLAFTLFSGLPSPDLIAGVVGSLKALVADPSGTISKDGLKVAIGEAEGLLQPPNGKNVPREIAEFRESFEKLLDLARVKQLVVLIDDLDRCLPDTAIETLEAVRLFLFTPRTAFVVAADEAMIGYAVRKHFPDLPESTGPRDYAKNYLEKLIQVPFRIPPLGQMETRIYVTLLFVSAEIGENNAGFMNLIEVAKKRLKRPWDARPLEADVIRVALGENEIAATNAIVLSDQIGPILAQGTQGNPRQIKRFLNTLLLRERMATARGFGADVQLPVLAKLMLAERFMSRTFEQIAALAAQHPEGRCEDLAMIERDKGAEPAEAKSSSASAKDDEKAREPAPHLSEWESSDRVKQWARIEPRLSKTDLRPYLFITKDRKDYLAGTSVLGGLAILLENLLGGKMAVQAMEPELKQLTQAEAGKVFEELRGRVTGAGAFMKEPAGIAGITVLVKAHPTLQSNLLDLLEMLPADECGPWPVQGWQGVITDANARARLDALLERWSSSNSAGLATAARGVRKTTRAR
ncbi:MAG TPA: Qat anti-phage system ATPase QatA [Usitatibacter sp.]|jgi:hypothetical protein|nr:Qat anti-phage system ATPase QatA [Usitatibacter sp.]